MKFTCIVTRDTTESCVVDIEAESLEAAQQMENEALELATENGFWALDEGNEQRPYITSEIEPKGV